MKGLTSVKTLLHVIVACFCLTAAGEAFAEKPETPPPGMGKYVMVLWDPGTPIPGEEASGRKVKRNEPDVAGMGGHLVESHGNRRYIFLPKGQAKKLRRHPSVAYLQRIWMGEPLDEWDEPSDGADQLSETTSSSRGVASDSDTDLTWGPVDYHYDGSGNIKQTGDDHYTYDSAGRLTRAEVSGKVETYEYDAFGNLIQKAIAGASPVVTPVDGASNRQIGPEYDAAGNVLTTGNRDEYRYDSLGMMSFAGRPVGVRRRYIYDADDERIGEVHDPTFVRWTVRDFDGRPLREFTSPGATSDPTWSWERDYVYAGGMLVGGETQEWGFSDTPYVYGGRRHYHLDHLGSVRMVTNDDDRAVAIHDYYPFGIERTLVSQELIVSGNPQIDSARFTGHERDFYYPNIETTDYIDYMHARFYDPNRGRFLSPDPLPGDPSMPQSWNRYAYVVNNPTRYNDPTGEKFMPGYGPGIINPFDKDDFCHMCDERESFCYICPKNGIRIDVVAKDPLTPIERPEPSMLNRILDRMTTTLGGDDIMRVIMGDDPVYLLNFYGKQIPAALLGALNTAKIPFVVLDDTVLVSRWGRPGLEAGDWVMQGDATLLNYLRSFKWQPGVGNKFARHSTGATYRVPASSIKWPRGWWGIDGAWKGIFGHRRYFP